MPGALEGALKGPFGPFFKWQLRWPFAKRRARCYVAWVFPEGRDPAGPGPIEWDDVSVIMIFFTAVIIRRNLVLGQGEKRVNGGQISKK